MLKLHRTYIYIKNTIKVTYMYRDSSQHWLYQQNYNLNWYILTHCMYTENQEGVDPPTVCLGSGSVFYLYVPPPPSHLKTLSPAQGFIFPTNQPMLWDGMVWWWGDDVTCGPSDGLGLAWLPGVWWGDTYVCTNHHSTYVYVVSLN